jgi:hypothetical protein
MRLPEQATLASHSLRELPESNVYLKDENASPLPRTTTLTLAASAKCWASQSPDGFRRLGSVGMGRECPKRVKNVRKVLVNLLHSTLKYLHLDLQIAVRRKFVEDNLPFYYSADVSLNEPGCVG